MPACSLPGLPAGRQGGPRAADNGRHGGTKAAVLKFYTVHTLALADPTDFGMLQPAECTPSLQFCVQVLAQWAAQRTELAACLSTVSPNPHGLTVRRVLVETQCSMAHPTCTLC